jgi:tRNA dimethylallyltransferase
MSYNLITILGPTAVGKTRLAALLAKEYDGEIVSADSRQVYKGMDIGTGKDYEDYIIDGYKVPYYLIDVIDPKEEFNLFLFSKYFYEAYSKITGKKKLPILAGGTGLYLHSILTGYKLKEVEIDENRYSELINLPHEELKEKLLTLNPDQHNKTDLDNKERTIRAIMIAEGNNDVKLSGKPDINSLVIGVNEKREKVKENITIRLKERLKSGMIEEVENLLKAGISYDKMDFFGLEYKYIGKYLRGDLNYNDMYQKLNSAIHNFAKRQITWFRKMEKEGIEIFWIDGPDFKAAKKLIEEKYLGD